MLFFLKDKCSPCKLEINFGFLSFYSEMLGTLLCIEAFLLQSYSIPNFSLHSLQISKHCSEISLHIIKIAHQSITTFVKDIHGMTLGGELDE